MNKPTSFPLISLILVLSLSSQAFTSSPISTQPTLNNVLVCAPGFFTELPAECANPSPYTDVTSDAYGISLVYDQAHGLAYTAPDPQLNVIDARYYLVNDTGTAFYPSIDAAREKKGAVQVINPGDLIYVIYTERIDTEKGTFFLLPNGLYMPGDGSTVTVQTPFPGIEIKNIPIAPFGFVFTQTQVYAAPSEIYYNRPVREIGPGVSYYPVVDIWATMNIKGETWHMIGINEWVNGRSVAVVTPKTSTPEGVTDGSWIDVDLAEQSLAVYENNKLIYATVMASGAEPLFTKPGLFQVFDKKESETMNGERNTPNFYHLENVPWTMYFDKARALHGAYWRARLGFPQSHGCVNLYPGDAHWLFNWAKVGTWVNVYDTTGKTPTDPEFYGDGGA
jgi:lipoprotein-anchoring transpeptidase ErfK/SrfK